MSSENTSAVPEAIQRKAWVMLGLLLTLAILAVYWPVLSADFVYWDDDVEITSNPHLGPLTWERLVWAFTDTQYVWRYQPLSWLGWFLNYQFGGLNPFGYHLVNLVFHIANALLVMALIDQLLWRVYGEKSGAAAQLVGSSFHPFLLAAGLGSLFWAIHPIRVEPVAWATCRLYVQALFFLLISFLSYLGPGSTHSLQKQRGWYIVSLIAYLASLLSYPLAITFPGVLIITDLFLSWRDAAFQAQSWLARLKQLLLNKVPFILAGALVLSVALFSRFFTNANWPKPAGLETFTPLERTAQSFYIWGHYLWRPFYPFDFSPLYSTLADFKPLTFPFIASTLLVLGVTTVLIWNYRRAGLALGLWLAHLTLLVPHLGLTEHPHFPSDRYGYIVGICLAILVSGALVALLRHKERISTALIGLSVVLVALGVLARWQTSAWSHTLPLFSYIIDRVDLVPYRAFIYFRGGIFYQNSGRYTQAERWLKHSLILDPNSAHQHWALAGALAAQKKVDEAAFHYKQAIRYKPDNPSIHIALGDLYYDNERLEDALAAYQEALKHGDKRIRAAEQMSSSRLALNRTDVGSFSAELGATHENIGIVLARQGLPAEAEPHFRSALAAAPEDPNRHHNLALALRSQGKTNEAGQHFQKARALRAQSQK